MRRKQNKGFTLAELLIVVAIIAVLVAISIPIFSKQLEKARDATSVANIRSAYAEAMTAYMTNDVAKSHWNSDSVHHVWINYKNGEINAIDVIVNIKSKKQNDWSGLGKNLPFPLNSIKDNKANPGRYMLVINFDSSGNPTSAGLIDVIRDWKSDSKLQ
ncbi:MAG: prepilin-type N-terminal cleavage/methylation domain-containing protein [Stecheria intestinalis]|nr:prepilin-type N-terminal cleavage/methylation domain-containing protein [Stecheria intestinalis]MDY4681485.1 prepilin-type N-terminal cleavage/methylation domain-containing protein [Lachnospiraceae bacterium]